MRRLIPILASLYPRRWRERYGAEFDALLEDVHPSAGTAFDIFTGAIAMQIRTWSYGWMFLISTACACAAFAAILFAVPETYVSQGTLLFNGTVPFAQADLDSLNEIAQRVESRSRLTNIVAYQKLYLHERSRMQLQDVLDLMRRNVRIEPAAGQRSSKMILVSFNYADPQIAQRVTRDLIAAFIDQSFRVASNGPPTFSLRILDPASLPLRPLRSVPNIAAVSAFGGLLVLGLLTLLHRRALRQA